MARSVDSPSSRRTTATAATSARSQQGSSIRTSRSNGHSASHDHADDQFSHSDESHFRHAQHDDITETPSLEPGMVCVSVIDRGPRLAFACYRQDDHEIVVQDCPSTGQDVETLIDEFFQRTQPTLILVSLKMLGNTALMDLLTSQRASVVAAQVGARHDPTVGTDDGNSAVGNANKRPRSDLGATVAQPAEQQQQSQQLQQPQAKIPYRILKSSSYNMATCTSTIMNNLHVLSLRRRLQQPQQRERRNRGPPLVRQFANDNTVYRQPSVYNAMAALIDWDSSILVQALGSLLSFLLQTPIYSMDGIVTVNGLAQIYPHQFMYVPTQTYQSLHIFATDHHPLALAGGSCRSGGGRSKEGWSLFSLLDRTRSKGGRLVLREWMMRPLQCIDAIRQRQDTVELFLRPDLATAVGKLLTLLAKVGPVHTVLHRIQRCVTQPQDLVVLVRTLSSAIGIYHVLRQDLRVTADSIVGEGPHGADAQQGLLGSIADRIDVDIMDALSQQIATVIDEQACMDNKGIVIRRGFNEQLDSWKDQYEDLPIFLEHKATELLQAYPLLLDVTVVFFPQIGFLISLPTITAFHTDNVNLPAEFEHKFNQDTDSFFKNPLTHELDEEIGDLDMYIKDMEGMIITELEEEVLDSLSELQSAFRALSELDCLLAFADCASNSNYVRPTIVAKENRQVKIINGRHPLQEITAERGFVPNSTDFTQHQRVHIVTGPNFSGKSCYARQVGLLVYMAHIGSFIPCDEATICIVQQIFSQIGSVETCAVPQSTFQLDLSQMGNILRRASKHSLVLIDEFGKGTSPASGIALLKATMDRLAAVGAHVVCTTHFLELFAANMLQDGRNGVKAKQMTVQLPDHRNGDNANPLFRLANGIASSSAGLVCAKQAGVDRSILVRAREIIDAMRCGRRVWPMSELLDGVASHGGVQNPPTISDDEHKLLKCFLAVDRWDAADADRLRQLIVSSAAI